MIDLVQLEKCGAPWVVRHTGAGALANVDLVIPPAARNDPLTAAGDDYRFGNRGRLVVLGWAIRANIAGAGQGLVLIDRRGASDQEIRRVIGTASGVIEDIVDETYLPLRPALFPPDTLTDPSRLRLEIVGTEPTQFSVLVWGIWTTEERRNHGAAPLSI